LKDEPESARRCEVGEAKVATEEEGMRIRGESRRKANEERMEGE
jgi:hypothetical protein